MVDNDQSDNGRKKRRSDLLRVVQDLEDQLRTTKRERDNLHDVAYTDPLTGIPNRRRMMEVLEEELEISRQTQSPFSIIFLDLDHFKKYNDAYGQVTGDKILIAFANAVKDSMRKDDTICRLGGEEFVIILPHTTEIEALKVIEQRKSAILSLMKSKLSIDEQITFSAGISSSLEIASFEQVGKLIEYANEAEGAAKHGGRDRTYVSICQAIFTKEELEHIYADPKLPSIIRDFRLGLISEITTKEGSAIPFSHFLKIVNRVDEAPEQVGEFKITRQGDSACAYVGYSRAPNEKVLNSVRDTSIQIIEGLSKAGLETIPDPNILWQYGGKVNSLNLLLTLRCPMNCIYCAQDHKDKTELAADHLVRVIDEVTEKGERKGVVLWLTGGEPLTRKELAFAIMEYGIQHGMYGAMNTSAILITDRLAAELLKTGINSLNISLDSGAPLLEDQITRTKYAYKRVLEGLVSIAKNREGSALQRVTLNYVVNNQNYKYFLDFIKSMCTIRDSKQLLIFNDINPLPVKDAPGLYLTVEQMNEFNAMVYAKGGILDLAAKHNLPLLALKVQKIFAANIADPIARLQRQVLACHGIYYGVDSLQLPCAMAMTSLTITPKGDAFPCTYHREARSHPDCMKMGNIRDSSVADMQAKYFEHLRHLPLKPDGRTPNPICQNLCSPDLVGMRIGVVNFLGQARVLRLANHR